MEPLQELAAFVANLTYESLPDEVRSAVAACVLDTISAGAGAAGDAQVRRVAKQLLPLDGAGGGVSLWGREKRASLFFAVFLNAMAAHTFEMDDVHTASKTHIGTVVIPAAWGLAELLGADGKTLLTAVTAGYEAAARIGMSLGVVSHRTLGWHATSTAGVFGAAAACARLLDLDEREMLSALALGGSQACGVWAFLGDGASSKTLNPARAAVNGCTAAFLAKAGMTGPAHILTAADGGLFQAMTQAPEPERVNAELGKAWEILKLDKKPYPCCRSTHCAIDAALCLRNEYGLTAKDVSEIRISTYEVGYKQCGLSPASLEPRTPGQAKFSTPYTVARALLDGSVSLYTFRQDAVDDAAAAALMKRITVVPDDAFSQVYPANWGCKMRIETTAGAVYEKTVANASGSVSNPQTHAQLMEKARSLFDMAPAKPEDDICTRLLDLAKAAALPTV